VALQPNMSHGILMLKVSRSHTQQHNKVSRTPLDNRSAHHRDLYLTTHNTNNTHTSMPLEGFEPPVPASEQPQTYALDLAATGMGNKFTQFN